MTDLSLVPIEELFEEINKRFDHVVLCGKKYTGQDSKTFRRYKGDFHICAGLADDVKMVVLLELKNRETPLTSDDL